MQKFICPFALVLVLSLSHIQVRLSRSCVSFATSASISHFAIRLSGSFSVSCLVLALAPARTRSRKTSKKGRARYYSRRTRVVSHARKRQVCSQESEGIFELKLLLHPTRFIGSVMGEETRRRVSCARHRRRYRTRRIKLKHWLLKSLHGSPSGTLRG